MGDTGFASDHEILQYQRMTSQLYFCGAATTLVVLVLPHWQTVNDLGLAGVILALVGVAAALRVRGAPLPHVGVRLMPLPGVFIITAGVWAAGPAGAGAVASFYTMVAMGAFTFLARRVGISYLVGAAIMYGGLLAHWGISGWPAQTALMFATSLIASYTAGRLMQRIRVLAWHDDLTGLANRRAWYSRLDEELARARRRDEPVTVAVIDLDHFKAVNDAGGHDAGDRLLRLVATTWSEQLRREDTLARWGGDEFGLILTATDASGAIEAVDRLRANLPAGQTFSAGVATAAPDDTPDDVVLRADRALYQAKEQGRACTALQEAV